MSDPHIRTLFQSRLMRIFDYRCTGDDNDGEIPQGYEVALTRAGTYQRYDAHGRFLVDPNQVSFYNRGEPYDISHPMQGGDSSTIFVLAPALLLDITQRYNPAIVEDSRRIFQRSHITLAAHLQILQYTFLHADQNHSDPLGLEEQVILSLDEIIRALHQDRPMRHSHSSTNTLRAHGEQIHLVKTFLNTHVRSSLQLEQISAAAHLSPYHLCRMFKQNMGMTLHHYVKRLRLFNAAEQMLENPKARLDLLALEYGFSNHGNFSTAFRQTFGVHPSALRSSHVRQISKNLKA